MTLSGRRPVALSLASGENKFLRIVTSKRAMRVRRINTTTGFPQTVYIRRVTLRVVMKKIIEVGHNTDCVSKSEEEPLDSYREKGTRDRERQL